MNRVAVGLANELRVLPLLTTLTSIALAVLLAHASGLTAELLLFFLSLAFLLYAVHALDTYEDYFVRKEDQFKTFTFAHGSSGHLHEGELKALAAFSSLSFLAITAWIAINAGVIFLFLMLSAFAIGVSYSHILSKNLFASLTAYPLGVVFAMASAYILAGGSDWSALASLAAPLFLLFVGVRILMDAADSGTDAKIKAKPNIANLYGEHNAKLCSLLFLLAGLALALLASFNLIQLVVSLLLTALFVKSFFAPPAKAIWLVAPGVYLFLLTQGLFLLWRM